MAETFRSSSLSVIGQTPVILREKKVFTHKVKLAVYSCFKVYLYHISKIYSRVEKTKLRHYRMRSFMLILSPLHY